MTKKILVVDDEEDILVILQSRLLYRGYEVLTATTGVRALEIIQLVRPDLIILDIMMPRMDGIQLSETLRQKDSTKMIPIIFLTALQKKEDEKTNGPFVSGRIIFAKPFDTQKLLHQVELLLGKTSP